MHVSPAGARPCGGNIATSAGEGRCGDSSCERPSPGVEDYLAGTVTSRWVSTTVRSPNGFSSLAVTGG